MTLVREFSVVTDEIISGYWLAMIGTIGEKDPQP